MIEWGIAVVIGVGTIAISVYNIIQIRRERGPTAEEDKHRWIENHEIDCNLCHYHYHREDICWHPSNVYRKWEGHRSFEAYRQAPAEKNMDRNCRDFSHSMCHPVMMG